MAIAAFKAGLHVLCEKPIAGALADADRMRKAAAKAGKVLQINQSLRYHPPYVKAAQLIADGAIGELIHMRCLRASGSTPDKGWSPGATWFVSKAAQGGLLLDIGIHMLDAFRWFGGEIAQVSGITQIRTPGIDVPDNVRAQILFANGATGQLELSWTIPVGGGLFEIYGTKGTLRMGFAKEPLELIVPGPKGPRTTYPKVPQRVPNSFQSFVAAVRGKAPSPTDGDLGRAALAICLAVADSQASGRVTQPSRG